MNSCIRRRFERDVRLFLVGMGIQGLHYGIGMSSTTTISSIIA